MADKIKLFAKDLFEKIQNAVLKRLVAIIS